MSSADSVIASVTCGPMTGEHVPPAARNDPGVVSEKISQDVSTGRKSNRIATDTRVAFGISGVGGNVLTATAGMTPARER